MHSPPDFKRQRQGDSWGPAQSVQQAAAGPGRSHGARAPAPLSCSISKPIPSEAAPLPSRPLRLCLGGAPELFLELGDGDPLAATPEALLGLAEDLANAATRLRLPGSASYPACKKGDMGFHIRIEVGKSAGTGALVATRAYIKPDVRSFALVARASGVRLAAAAAASPEKGDVDGPVLDRRWFDKYRDFRWAFDLHAIDEAASRAKEESKISGRGGRSVPVDLSRPAIPAPEAQVADEPSKTSYHFQSLDLPQFNTEHFQVSYDVQTRPHIMVVAKHSQTLSLRGSYYDLEDSSESSEQRPRIKRELFGGVAEIMERFSSHGSAKFDIQIHLGGWRTQGQFHLHLVTDAESYQRTFANLASSTAIASSWPTFKHSKSWMAGFKDKILKNQSELKSYVEKDARIMEELWHTL
eukprot:tig00021221_g19343.t1